MTARRIEVITKHLKWNSYINPNLTMAQSYEYTLDNNILTTKERDFYETYGYLLMKKLIPDTILDECRDHFINICNGKFDKGNMILMKEIALMEAGYKGEHLYNKAQDILNDKIFSLYFDYPKLLDVVECFTGPNIMAVHSMFINKPPGTTRHPPHQDLHYFPFRPANRIVATWTAMEDVFIENGCLYVVPGSHKGTLYAHNYTVDEKNKINKAYHGIQNEDKLINQEDKVYVIMEKGDTVFFHPKIIHGSGVNTTNNFRKSISGHFAASECHYIDVTGTTQENIAIETENMAKRRGWDIDFKMIWKIRARCVRGQTISL